MFVHNLMNSGLIYFMLMYSGSNIIEIIKFLRKNHLNEANSDFSYQNLQASVLYHILPEALIFYLTNNTPESFMKIFLSDTKSPQVIWNSSMRKWMINKLSAHVSEFLPILNENILSIYEYVPIIKIEYPQLDKELFCHGLYLKYLCLEKEKLSKQNFRFSNPIEFLRTLLKQWQDELLKEGNSAMYINACKVLELEPEALGVGSISHNLNEEELKNKYRMLSRKYHPDNPKTGNEAKFIEMQEAYAFICGKKYDSGPNPDYLHYYIQVQIILLQFHRAELSNYKYPGYNAILSSLSHDLKNIFAKKIFSTLVVDCIKLVEETLVCSQLNCLELIHVDALNTLIDVLRESANNLQHLDNYSSRTTEVEICISILNCLTVGGVYFEFVEVLYQNKIILQLIVQMMNLK
ncbi:MAG: DnaJ subfamily C member 13, partial [Marteilia pararefringens]